MLKIISIFILLYIVACIFLYVKQRSILFYPTPESFNNYAEPMWFETASAKLKAWKINQSGPAIIYFGGNSEVIEDNIADYKKLFPGYTVYLVNYRGYGGSSGSPTEEGLFNDALAVYDQLTKQHASISVIGRSLGSGVACYLASKRNVDKLVLTTPYDSIRFVAQSHYPVFPVKWLIKDHFDSFSYAPSISSQILVLFAESDQVVPINHTKNLLKFLPGAIAQQIGGSAHNDISSKPLYQQFLAEFLTPNE